MEVSHEKKGSRKSQSQKKRKQIKKSSLDAFANSMADVDWFFSESVVPSRVGFSFFQAAIINILEDVKNYLKVSGKQFEVDIEKYESEYHAVVDCFIEQKKKPAHSEMIKKISDSVEKRIHSFGRLNLHVEFCIKNNLAHGSTILKIKIRGQSLDEKLT